MFLHTWPCQGPTKPSGCTTFTLNSHWGRAATSKKNPVFMNAGSLQSSLTLCDPVDCGLPGFSVREGVLQARILEHSGQYWLPYLLEHCISCCPSRQPRWVPGAARTPATHTAAPPPPLALTGPIQALQGSLRSKPQWATHMQRWE